jgi:hypothetical protein
MYSQYHPKWGKSETISSKIKNERKVPTLSLLFNLVIKFLTRAISEEKETKGM